MKFLRLKFIIIGFIGIAKISCFAGAAEEREESISPRQIILRAPSGSITEDTNLQLLRITERQAAIDAVRASLEMQEFSLEGNNRLSAREIETRKGALRAQRAQVDRDQQQLDIEFAAFFRE